MLIRSGRKEYKKSPGFEPGDQSSLDRLQISYWENPML